jgi:hypothetical protein
VLSVLKHPVPEEEHMKSDEEIMQILEAFDLTKSYRDAAELAGCSPNSVAHYVEARAAGCLTSSPARRDQIIDDYLDKLEELIEASKAKVRADVVHDKLGALGYVGSERTTRRGVAAAKKAYRAGAAQGVPAVGARAGHVVPVRLVRRACGLWEKDVAVLRLAFLVALSGRAGGERQDDPEPHFLHRPEPAPIRGRAHLRIVG